MADKMKRAVIVAASSSGMGRASAIALSRENQYSLSLCARRKKELDETRDLCIQAGISPDQIICVYGDMEIQQDRERLVQETVNKFGGVYGLVNFVGVDIYPDDITCEGCMALYDSCVTKHLAVPLALINLVLPYMEKCGGVIMNISAPLHPMYGLFSLNTTTRAAVDGMIRSLAHYLGPKGIRCYALNAGCINTETWRHFLPKATEPELETVFTLFHGLQAIQRTGLSSDMGDVVRYLISDNASFLTGICVPVDGGMEIPYMGDSERAVEEMGRLIYPVQSE